MMIASKCVKTTLLLIGCVLTSYAQSNFTSQTIGIGIVVADLDKSLDFYVNGIGMVKTGSFTINENFGKRSGLTNGVFSGKTFNAPLCIQAYLTTS